MEPTVLLCDSLYCRLCADENRIGTDIFTSEENQPNLQEYINKYLPIKVDVDEKLPTKICPGCHIQLEATKIFMDLIIEGQAKLRQLVRNENDKLNRQEKQRMQLEEVLHNVNPNSSVETYTIESDDNGEKYVIQIISEGPLFPPDHELSLKVEGLEKPKRKRGRPPKPPPEPIKEENVEIKEDKLNECKEEEEEEIGPDGRKKRKIRAPSRYQGVVQGKELDKFFIDEGVLDEDEIQINPAGDEDTNLHSDNIIGRIENEDGQDTGQLIFVNKSRHKHGPAIIRRKKKYSCEICKKDFLHVGRYEHHRKSHNIQFVCLEENCGKESKLKNEIIEHQNQTGHKGINPIEKIEPIGKEVLSDEVLEHQIENVDATLTEDSEYKCDLCKKVFSCKQNYEGHVRAVHNQEKPYECYICDKSFPYIQSLNIHKITHTKEHDSELVGKQYPCDKCTKIFTHPSSLLYHKNSEHNNGRRFVCNKCNKSFKHKQLLQRHQLVHSDDRPYKCTICETAFKTKANLLNHEAVHTGEKRYCCNQCGNSFAHKTSLTLHLRWHQGHKPYKCDVCGKAFSQRGNLLEHKRIHTGEKPYCCDHCGKSFTTSSQYKLHCKRHTGERPWRCEACAKCFLHKTTWKTHIRRHNNERPYKCRFCQKGFSEAWALKKHERLHTGEKPYKCDKCGKSFSDSSNMIKHRKTHDTITNVKHATIQIIDSIPQTTLIAEELENVVNSLSKNNEVNISDSFEIRQIDDEGQLLLNTDDGQPIRIIQDENNGESSVRGLLPDGTIVPIDWSNIQNKDIFQIQGVEVGDTGLLDGSIQFMSTAEDVSKGVDGLEANLRFVNEDGQEMCFVTTYAVDDNSLNPQILTMSKDGILNMKL